MGNKTITNADNKTYLKDYTESSFFITETKLEVELGEGQKNTHVLSKLQITSNENNPSDILVLCGENINLLSVSINDVILNSDQYSIEINTSEAGKTAGTLTIPNAPKSFDLTLSNSIHPQSNKACKGLYKAGTMFCTQCEAEGFRNITYYLDRPDVMSVFTVTITGNKKSLPYMLCNGHKVSEQDNENGTHTVTWHDPSLKPAYLFALVAGDLNRIEDTFTTMSGRNVDLHIFADKNIQKSEMIFAMSCLQNSMKWDEERFNREYDLDLYMIVATDTFNMGAMENKGLNVFNTSCVLGSTKTATDDRLQRIDDVIAHEYFHNWSGNIVTCRDWFQLSLKEGLTVFRDGQYNADHTSHLIKRIEDVKLIRSAQFAEDAGPMAHPIRPHFFETINNFYTVTIYEKGAEIIHMIYGMLGKEGFKQALNLYFKRHKGQAVTTEEFVTAMEDSSKINLQQFRNWYDQGGTPLVEVETEYNQKTETYTIHLQQSVRQLTGYETPKPFHLPIAIGLLDEIGKNMLTKTATNVFCDGTVILDFVEQKQSFTFEKIKMEDPYKKPVLSFLRNFSAPVKVSMDQSNEDLLHIMQYDTDGYNRWEACDRLMTNEMKRLVTEIQAGKEALLDKNLISILHKVLIDSSIDNSMKRLMITLPTETTLHGLYKTVDIDAIYKARKAAKEQLAQALEIDLKETYTSLELADEAEARSLKNLCLSYLTFIDGIKYVDLAVKQYKNAKNFTDESAAFSNIVNSKNNTESKNAAKSFVQKWAENTDVMDTWFSVLAGQDNDSILSIVKSLMKHEKFDDTNPNKLRSVIAVFTSCYNRFHNIDGSGYAFLADQIIRLNAFNPEAASRFMGPFTGIKKFDDKRQDLIKSQVHRIEKSGDLSKDVQEKVSSILS